MDPVSDSDSLLRLRLLPLPRPLPLPLPLATADDPRADFADGILGPFLKTGVLGAGSGDDGGLTFDGFGDFGDIGGLGDLGDFGLFKDFWTESLASLLSTDFRSGVLMVNGFLSGECFLSGDFLTGDAGRLQELMEPSSSEPVE